jgi:hypothetical protein
MKGVAHYGVEVAAMDVMQIPATLPPAITVSREVAQLCLADDLVAYGAAGPAALAWRWALTGEGPTPVSLRQWHQGPPDHDTLLDESRWPYGDGWGGRAAQAEIDKARFLLWWLTASPDEEVPARFRRYQSTPGSVAGHGSVTATLTEVYGSDDRRPVG